MRKLIWIALAFCLSGCSFFSATYEVLDVIYSDDPKAVCDKDTVGVTYEGKTCLKLEDKSYAWK